MFFRLGLGMRARRRLWRSVTAILRPTWRPLGASAGHQCEVIFERRESQVGRD